MTDDDGDLCFTQEALDFASTMHDALTAVGGDDQTTRHAALYASAVVMGWRLQRYDHRTRLEIYEQAIALVRINAFGLDG